MKKKPIVSLSVSTSPYEDFIFHIGEFARSRKSKYTCVANVHMLVEGYRDPSFASVVNNADIATPDGKPLTWALRLIYGIKQERVAGMFLMRDVLRMAEENGISVFFYGSTPDVLDRSRIYVETVYPKLNLAGFISPPFKELTSEEEETYIETINKSGAQIVFVALGCPKQEKWMAKMRGRVNAVMIGVGAALPVLIGMRKKAPMWVQNSGFEWLFRLSLEPKRLFRRYMVTNSVFIFLLTRELIRVKIFKRQPLITGSSKHNLG